MSASQKALDRLRDAFARAGYDENRLADRGAGSPGGGPDDVWPLRAAAAHGPLSVLIRLWMLGAAVEASAAAAALAPAEIDELVGAGLLARVPDDRVRGTVGIKPYRDLLIAADRMVSERDEVPDYVPGVNPIARILARHTVRVQADRCLDLATGNGIQALAASRHCGEVVGTDVNPRALDFARLNARLNGVTNIDLREGSWFDPVGDAKFDLVLANLPFVVSPDTTFLYRDSGLPPGELGREVVRGAAERLTDGGFAHVMCEWGVREGEDWADTPRAWSAQTGCDAVLLRHLEMDPTAHAVSWNQRLAGVDPDLFEEVVERWSEHHARQRYASLVGATIVLRRRRTGGAPWTSAFELDMRSATDAGDHVLALFEGEDLARSLRGDPRALLGARLRLREGLRVDQVLSRREERWRQRPARVRLDPGLGLQAKIDPRALDLVFALDGSPVHDVTEAVSARKGRAVGELRELALAVLPDLIRRGFISSPS